MYYFPPISNDDLENIYSLYNYNAKTTQEAIETIKEWLKKQPHLPETPSDFAIRVFLIMRKFQIEEVKKFIDSYYTHRWQLGDGLFNPTGPELKEYMKDNFHIPMPKLTKDYCRVVVFKTESTYETFDTTKSDSLNFALNTLQLFEDYAVKHIFIFDMNNYHLKHMLKINPIKTREKMQLIKKYSMPIKAIHIINCPSFIDNLLTLIRFIVSEKVFNRVKIHKNVEELYEYIDRKILPKDYGVEEKSLKELNEKLQDTHMHYKNHFDRIEELKVNESLRLEQINDDILGFHGNFRKFEVD